MAKLIGIVGSSGSGKSTSARTLKPETTFIINVAGKDLPFRGWKKKYQQFDLKTGKGNIFSNSDPKTIGKVLAFISKDRPEVDTVILDDVGMILAFQQFARASEKGWDKYAEMAADFASIILAAKDLRENLHIFFMLHEEEEENSTDPTKKRRIISVTSRAVREKLNPERLFTYTFFTSMKENEETGDVDFGLITGKDLQSASKTPMGCFNTKVIPNDIQLIIDTIARYENDENMD